LKDDLSETKDAAAAQPDVVERLTNLMQQYIANGRSTPGSPQKNAAPVSLGGGKVRKGRSAGPE
jgi:arylsulfatase A